MKRRVSYIALIVCVFIFSSVILANDTVGFVDVPTGDWSEQDINELRALGITDGIGNNEFGYNQTLTREQFVKFLCDLNKWELYTPVSSEFTDNQDSTRWSYSYIETALLNGVIELENNEFRPSDNITREEIVIMIVKSLGYEWLAQEKNMLESPFNDVDKNNGYITILKDFGIINGKSETIFDPLGSAKRQEAAAILMRMYRRTNAELNSKNAFYAERSYPQVEMMESFDTISFGWASLEVAAYSDTDSLVHLNLDYPDSYNLPIDMAIEDGKEIYLSIFAEENLYTGNNGEAITTLLTSEISKAHIINELVDITSSEIEFDGITIDFEAIRGEENRLAFASFIEELGVRLHEIDKKLMVMVQPDENYDGYDYKMIAKAADMMVIMAHDYGARELTDEQLEEGYIWTPVASILQVYDTLSSVKEQIDIEDLGKISFQISFSTTQWKLEEGKVINRDRYTPSYSVLYDRLIDEGTTIQLGEKSKSPYATYIKDGYEENIIWYEDERSIADKLEMAKMFGLSNVSVWRLGNIPERKDEQDKNVYMDVLKSIK